jgi:hypothetical protein
MDLFDIDTFTDVVLPFILAFIGLMLIFAPIALWFQFRHPAKVFVRVLSSQELPVAAKGYFDERVETILLWGFDLVTYLKVDFQSEDKDEFLVLLSNPHTQEWAVVSSPVSPKTSNGHMAFTTYCSEGLQVDTSTELIAPSVLPRTEHHVFRFPRIKDVFTLYRLHRKLVDRTCNGAPAVLPPPGQEVAELQRRLERFGPSLQTRGFLRLDNEGKCYRLTLKGAIVAGWRSIWPVPMLRRWKMRAQSDSLLREIARTNPGATTDGGEGSTAKLSS